MPPPRPPPKDVGIRGIYVYFPRLMVQQVDLEAADGCSGKYTAGLGQEAMTFCGDREDVVSMAATAVLRLLEASGVSPRDVGKLEVGTETGVDRSKSVASYLVEHFAAEGNHTLQGADHMHGCYGGTSALTAVADWVCSPSWDGRLGLAVATDIAVYPEGSPARPTGGGGAAALLVGPDAPLALEPWPWRAHFAAHTFDFFKPHGHPLYPVVDGPATTLWFTKAADACAAQLHRQVCGLLREQREQVGPGGARRPGQQQQQHQEPQQHVPGGLLGCFDHFISHAPYNKIVRKIFARLVMQDSLRQQQQQEQQEQEQQERQQGQGAFGRNPFAAASAGRPVLPPPPPGAAGLDPDRLPDSSIADKQLERAALAASGELWDHMAAQASSLQRQLGNLYTASLYSGLAALLAQQGEGLAGKRLLCFSFGSGVVASMFVLRGRSAPELAASTGELRGEAGSQEQQLQQQQQQQQQWRQVPCTLQHMADQLRLPQRLAARLPRTADDFDAAMASLRAAYGAADYVPSFGPPEELEEGAVYLERVDGGFRRRYGRRPR